MAAPIEKRNLIGLITLEPSITTDYYFVLPTLSGTKLPNALDNVVLEEVYINVDTTNGAVRIFLPAITTFNLAWNAKIYINWKAGSNQPRIIAYEGSVTPPITADNIDGQPYVDITDLNATQYLHIVAPNTWMAIYSV